MIITSIKKRKGDLIVTFEDDSSMTVEYDIYLKYHLTPSLDMDEKKLKEMREENAFLFFKKLALKRLAKMMTAYELYNYLLEKKASEGIAKQIIHDFKTKKYLNDDAYVSWYISSKKFIEGPRLITDKLKQKGVDYDLISTHVHQIDEQAVLQESIEKRLKKTHITQNKNQITIKLKRYYLARGFSLDVVNQCVRDAVSTLNVDEPKLLAKDLEKLLRKKTAVDKQKLIEKLYRKGYKYADIKAALEDKDI